MTTGAILDEDVPKEAPKQSINTDDIVDENRLNFINAIAKRNADKSKGEFQPFDGDNVVEPSAEDGEPDNNDHSGDDTDKPIDGDKSTAEGDGNAGDDDKGKPPQDAGTAAEEMITVKVDGQERQVSLSEIKEAGIRTYQKSAAADSRLEEASKLLKEMQQERDLFKQRQMQAPHKTPEKTKEQIEIESAKQRLDVASDRLVEAQAYDGPEEFKKALKEYEAASAAVFKLEVQAGGPMQPVDEIVRQEFARREAEDTQRNHRAILQKLEMPADKGGYEDLLKDRRAYLLMHDEVNNLIQNGAPDVYDTYKTAGDTVRDFLGIGKKEEPPQGNKAASDAALDAKRQKKIETADNIKSTGAVHKTSANDKPPTREELIRAGIAELRKARGQRSPGY